MGNSIIRIEVVGDHGVSRETKAGDQIAYDLNDTRSPDALAKRFVDQLAQVGSVVSAEIVHWPDSTPIIDNLKTGTRGPGAFVDSKFQGDRLLELFEDGNLPFAFVAEGQYTMTLAAKGAAAREIARPFKLLAYELVLRVPNGPERTLALRDLLSARDNAIRAVLYAPKPQTGGR